MILQNSGQQTQIEKFLNQIKRKSDKSVNYFLAIFFIGGLLLASFYDTWMVGISIGGLSLLAYYSAKYALPDSDLYQYVLSVVFGIFMALYIYQMHGLFEMHFIAFIGSAILITYQNWKLQLPLTLFVVLHHAVFAYLQYAGFDKVYFTQVDFMDLQTFIIHVSLAAVIFFTCGLWAYQFKKFSEKHIEQSFEIGKLQEDKLQKEALIESERQFREFFESAPHAIGIVDMETSKFVDFNSNALKLFKYSREELLQKTPGDVSAPFQADGRDSASVVGEMIGRVLAGEKPVFEWIHCDSSGKNIPCEIRLTMHSIRGRNLLQASVVDITEKKKAEAEIITLNESLEGKVKKRTEELETVNKELEAFSYSVSHDLRAPLRVIHGYGKMLLKGQSEKLDKQAQESLEIIMTNATHMGSLIDDLLDFSRLGRAALAKTTVNMTDMVKVVIEEVKVSSKAIAEIRFQDFEATQCDPTLMKQVWTNLISNAVKYSRKREKPVIEIGSTGLNGHRTYYIKDNGAGFDMQYSDKLFAVFQRLHKVTEYEGTGVGLALVQRIVTKHGGKIWAEAKVDEGATFYFTLSK